MSNFKKVHDEIAETVISGFQKIEDSVVGAYQKVEDKFVGQFLTCEGESVEEAKARLAAEQTARKEQTER